MMQIFPLTYPGLGPFPCGCGEPPPEAYLYALHSLGPPDAIDDQSKAYPYALDDNLNFGTPIDWQSNLLMSYWVQGTYSTVANAVEISSTELATPHSPTRHPESVNTTLIAMTDLVVISPGSVQSPTYDSLAGPTVRFPAWVSRMGYPGVSNMLIGSILSGSPRDSRKACIRISNITISSFALSAGVYTKTISGRYGGILANDTCGGAMRLLHLTTKPFYEPDGAACALHSYRMVQDYDLVIFANLYTRIIDNVYTAVLYITRRTVVRTYGAHYTNQSGVNPRAYYSVNDSINASEEVTTLSEPVVFDGNTEVVYSIPGYCIWRVSIDVSSDGTLTGAMTIEPQVTTVSSGAGWQIDVRS